MNTQLSKKIMRRIYLTYYLRLAFSPMAIKIYTLTILFLALSQLSSLPNIFTNMWGNPSFTGIINFWLSALSHTETSIQLIVLISIITLTFLSIDIYRNLSKTKTFISNAI